MRVVLSSLLFSALSLLAVATDAPAASDVIVLGKDNFTDFLKTVPLSMIEFYAPWCGHCQKLAPKYEVAATELVGTAKVAKVDCTIETDLCQTYDIKGFPTLKIFENGTISDYEGPRESDAIVNYLKKMKEPRLSALNKDTLSAFIDSSDVVVVGYLSSTDSEQFKLLQQVADKMFLSFSFGYIVDPAAATSELVLHKKADEPKTVYTGKLSDEEFMNFVNVESLPAVGEILPENYGTYVKLGLPVAYYFYEDDAQRVEGQKLLGAIAKEFRGKASLVTITAKFKQHGELLGCSGPFPWFTMEHPETHAKFPLKTDLTVDNIKQHIQGVLSGEILPFTKSEEIPETNEGPVIKVVGKSYETIVFDTSKDVFLELYAPWCGHCKSLAPIWEELGEKMTAYKEIVIAKMDGTENDLPANAGFELRGFPTLVLVKGGSNEVIPYKGSRTLDDMINFIRENAAHGAQVPPASPESANDHHDEL